MSRSKKPISIRKVIGIIAVIAVAFCAVAAGGKYIANRQKEGEVHTVAESALEKVLEISELPTVEYTYNAVAEAVNEKGEVKYYVAYEGKVTAGIDFSKIEFEIQDSEEPKAIVIKLPEVTVQDLNVNMGTMDFIFLKDTYETETISQEAFKLCQEDLSNRIKDEDALFELAAENARRAVRGLYEPWINQLYPEFSIILE